MEKIAIRLHFAPPNEDIPLLLKEVRSRSPYSKTIWILTDIITHCIEADERIHYSIIETFLKNINFRVGI